MALFSLWSPEALEWSKLAGILYPLPRLQPKCRQKPAPPGRARTDLAATACCCLFQWVSGGRSADLGLQAGGETKTGH